MESPGHEALISAVVVARNEAATLGVCLAAARRALDSVGGGEILLVDSASSDRTAEIGIEAGCRVLTVRKASRFCPSAMRWIGASRTRSRYLLFLDGDCELEPDFLPAALQVLEVDPVLGVVAGKRSDFYRTRKGVVSAPEEYYGSHAGTPSSRASYGGCALYRRLALNEAGSFDPFLRAKEEEELASRIVRAGYRIEVLPRPMIRHMTVPRESPRRLLRTLNHGFYVGRGQAARLFISRGQFENAFRGLDRVILVQAHLVLGTLCAWAAWRSVWWPALFWAVLSVAGFAFFALRARSIKRAAFYGAEWTIQGVCLFAGLLMAWRPADRFRWEGEERALKNENRKDRPGAPLSGSLTPRLFLRDSISHSADREIHTMSGDVESKEEIPPEAVTNAFRRWIFITWYPYCRRSDALGEQLGAPSYLVHYLRFKAPMTAPFKYVLQTLKTVWILLRERPDGVLVANPPVVAPLVIWLGSLFLGYRFIVDAHSGAFQHTRWSWSLPLQRFLAGRALATVVTNVHMAARVRAWGGRAEMVQDLSLNLDPTGPISRRGDYHVVFVCTFSVDEPVEAVVEAARRLPDVAFSFTGDASYAPRGFRANLPANVRLTGFIPDSEYLALLRGADAILVLTREDHTMQRGGYEAVALEKPLITSQWPLLRDVFSRGTVHVDNSPETIAAAILTIRKDPGAFRREMAALRRSRAVVAASQVSNLRQVCQMPIEGRSRA